MTRVLVLYYSMYGHVEAMAEAVAEGARKVGGVEVVIKRVPEIYEFWRSLRSERKLEQPHVSDEEWDVIEKQAEEEERQLREAHEKGKQVVHA